MLRQNILQLLIIPGRVGVFLAVVLVGDHNNAMADADESPKTSDNEHTGKCGGSIIVIKVVGTGYADDEGDADTSGAGTYLPFFPCFIALLAALFLIWAGWKAENFVFCF